MRRDFISSRYRSGIIYSYVIRQNRLRLRELERCVQAVEPVTLLNLSELAERGRNTQTRRCIFKRHSRRSRGGETKAYRP